MDFNTIFQHKYDSNAWKKLLLSLFPKSEFYAQAIPTELSETQAKDAKSVLQFGELILEDETRIQFFEVELQEGKNITRNRVGLRNLIHSNVIPGYLDGILAVYYNEKARDWRMTFISKSAYWDEEGNQVKNETQPRRYTYVLGETESCRTAKERFEILEKKAGQIGLEDILKAFAVERISKEFFDEYRHHFEKLTAYLESSSYLPLFKRDTPEETGRAIRNFVKKTMGRIVFLYFLQKKGWMGCTTNSSSFGGGREGVSWDNGEQDFLRKLFVGFPNKDQFYSQCLTQLFFNTLNNAARKPALLFPITGTQVPYLNGGLFEQDEHEPSNIDFRKEDLSDLFDFFEKYNFTIDENEPYETEVGIDPEMLGHIFENLLEENRAKGTFYTPKEIVHYMCQESLTEYLHTQLANTKEAEEIQNANPDNPQILKILIQTLVRHNQVPTAFTDKKLANLLNEKLKSVKICDPAIGSGAFPMGMLREVFECRRLLYPYLKTSAAFHPANIKKEIIQNNIYGVDIETGAVDIARLRFWLALVLDEEEPQPLPNLDYKIMQGNSLLEEFEGIKLDKIASTDEDEDIVFVSEKGQVEIGADFSARRQPIIVFDKADKDQLMLLLHKYFDPDEWKRKTGEDVDKPVVKRTIDEIVDGKLHAKVLKDKRDFQNKIAKREKQWADAKLKPENINQKSKEYKEYAIWKSHFERLDAIEEKLIAEQHHDEKPYFLWHLWFKEVFENGGFDIVIGNPPYVRQEALGDLKQYLKNAYPRTYVGTADLLVYFVELGYNVLKSDGTLNFIISNKWITTGYGTGLRKLLTDNKLLELIDFGDLPVFGATAYPCILHFQKTQNDSAFRVTLASEIPQKLSLHKQIEETSFLIETQNLDPEGWQLNNPIKKRLLDKLWKKSVPLEKYIDGEAYRGVLTGLSEAFVIDEEVKQRLILEDSKSEEIIKPMLMGRDIQKYAAANHSKYLLYIPWHFPFQFEKVTKDTFLRSETAFRENYPAVYNHLLQFKKQLLNRNKAETGIRYEWYAMQRWGSDYWQEFSKPKIMYQKFQVNPCFIYDEEGLYCNDSMWIIPTDDKYLLGVLNSKVGWYGISQYCSKIQNGHQLIFDYLRKIPIANPSKDEKQTIETLVNTILSHKKEGKDTIELETQVDELVYQLYDLSPEEIDLVEGREVIVTDTLEADDIVALTLEQVVLSEIKEGENKHLEFKSTLRFCLKEQKPMSYIEHSALKTLAAFFNSEGGTLYLGVDDAGVILGLENDYNSFKGHDKKDEFLKHFDNLIATSFGNEYQRLLELDFVELESKTICRVHVKTKAHEPVWLKNKEKNQDQFYIRRFASTVELTVKEQVSYIKEHWG